jgi:CheY-like chemotaxis protein
MEQPVCPRILVIDDNPASLELMTGLLRAGRYEPLAAEDGEKGLALAKSGRPDVVICDIHLPRMDGFEVVRRLKSDEKTRAIPVVAVTAFAVGGDRDRALAAGFDGYIGKPIVPEAFVSQVEQFLSSRIPAGETEKGNKVG